MQRRKRYNAVGPHVRKLRTAAKLSQAEFAAKCQRAGWDISREVLARIESQFRRVTDFEVLKLCSILRCTSRDLLGK